MDGRSLRDLLAVFAAIEAVKAVVQRFEDGEINVFDALEVIRDVTARGRAA
jgi:hypothetical protein